MNGEPAFDLVLAVTYLGVKKTALELVCLLFTCFYVCGVSLQVASVLSSGRSRLECVNTGERDL